MYASANVVGAAGRNALYCYQLKQENRNMKAKEKAALLSELGMDSIAGKILD